MILNILGLILLLTGFILVMRGMWLRKPNHPSLEGHGIRIGFRLAFHPWRYKDYWDKNGSVYDFVGRIAFVSGLLCFFLAQVLW